MTGKIPTETKRKPLPRFIQSNYGRGGDEYVRPLAPALAQFVTETGEGKRHTELGERYGALRTRIVALGTELERAKEADAKAARVAAEKGTKQPRPKVPAIETELAESREQLAILEGLISESAADLLAAAVPYAADAEEAASAALEAKLAEIRDALRAAEQRFQEAGELAGEASWIGELAQEGRIHAWRSGRRSDPAPNALGFLRHAVGAFDHDLARTAERREQGEREREQAQRKLPPGTQVWQEGRAFVVSADGKLEEVAR